MKKLSSQKFKLPPIYFITNKEEIKDIPIGVPFILGDKNSEPHLVRILEYEVLFQEALLSGYPFNFKKILEENGYTDLEKWDYENPVYMEYTSEGIPEDTEAVDLTTIKSNISMFKRYIKDSAVYVDVQKLKSLNVFPIWLNTIEEAINTNIHNYSVFNNNMYNKKLGGVYGDVEFKSPGKNLIVIDISGSIPKGVSATCLAMAKNLAESFYADIMITGSKSTLYVYEEMHLFDIDTVYEENGMGNDQAWFKKLVTADERHYRTAIVFGDNHSPCYAWSNSFNRGTKNISRKDGQEMCKWKVDKLISFHTGGTDHIAGYADWFKTEDVKKVDDWVSYLD